MELILCNNNLSVAYVVSLLYSNKNEKYILLTDQPNIEKFFLLLSVENINLQFLASSYEYWDIRLFKAKKFVKTLFSQNDIHKVRMYHQAFGGLYNWIAYYANKKGVCVEYNRIVKDQKYPKAHFTFNVLNLKLQYLFLFNTSINVLDRGNKTFMPKLSKKFFNKNNVHEIKLEVNNDIIQSISQQIACKLGLENNSNTVVLLTGSVISTKQVDISEYVIKTESLINYIGSENIVCKCHPRFDDEIEAEKKLQHIPSYIPMEFLLPYFNIFVGYNSTVLLQAVKNGKIAISLLDYYNPISVERRNQWYSYFSDGKIVLIKKNKDLKTYLSC